MKGEGRGKRGSVELKEDVRGEGVCGVEDESEEDEGGKGGGGGVCGVER